jgi:hypothetical protein
MCIIKSKLKGGQLLWYDEAFSEEKNAYEKLKVTLFL